MHHRLDAVFPSRGIKRIAYVNADQRTESLSLTSSSLCFHSDESLTGSPADCSYLTCDLEVLAESIPLEACPLCLIDILVYRMKLYLEASLPFCEGPNSASSSPRRSFPHEDMCHRLLEGFSAIP